MEFIKNKILSVWDESPSAFSKGSITLHPVAFFRRKQIAEAKNPNVKKQLERLRDATDKQIDGLVYELYGLSEEEIRIIESQ